MLQGCTDKLTQLSAYDFDLPKELIAQEPLLQRDQARLLVVNRQTGSITDAMITDLPSLMRPKDQLVFNDTKVMPARLKGTRETGGQVEILLHTPCKDGTWWALTRPARKIKSGQTIFIAPDLSIKILEEGEVGQRRVELLHQGSLEQLLEAHGQVPLPLYIRRPVQKEDRERYQTVYATVPGAAAAPTAGLHFTKPLLETLDAMQVSRIHVTLHVGLETFLPVREEDIRLHPMHLERCMIDPNAALQLNSLVDGARRICVGTTSVRTLESMVTSNGSFTPGENGTRLFIYPGYTFKAVDALLTNFHVPKSTLLMLVSAFAGYDLIRAAYAHAIEKQYRFFSYGDAMLIV